MGRFRSIFWRRGGVGGQDGADGEHFKDIKEAGVEAEQSNRGGGGASPPQEERLQPDEMQGAVEEEEKKIGESAMLDQKKADSVEATEVVAESDVAQ